MSVLLLGYDVETQDPDSPVTRQFLEVASRVHEEMEAPGTFFLCGRTVENNTEALIETQKTGLFDYQSHTYSHVLFKCLWQVNDEGERLVRSGSIEQIAEEVDKANRVLKERLGVTVTGLTTPWGYYRGLGDRPDLLAILHGNGIRFVRSWMRNEKDWVPNPLEVQPFFYECQGFPDMLEFPMTGRHDCDWSRSLGFEPREFDNVQDYAEYVAGQLEIVAEHDWAWPYNQHDHSTMRHDPEMVVIRRLIEKARELGMEVALYRDYYKQRMAEKERAHGAQA